MAFEAIFDFSLEADKRKLYRVLQSRKPRRYVVTIKEDRNKRSGQQNRYYHGVVLALIAQHTGHSGDELHEIFKMKFLSVEKVFEVTGEVVRITRSTTELNTAEFSEYLDKIIQFALDDLDIIIPEASENILQIA